jgi:hypothetical protein
MGRGYQSKRVIEFRARNFTQNMYLGVPSVDFVGTKVDGEFDAELLGSITSFSTMSRTCASISFRIAMGRQ